MTGIMQIDIHGDLYRNTLNHTSAKRKEKIAALNYSYEGFVPAINRLLIKDVKNASRIAANRTLSFRSLFRARDWGSNIETLFSQLFYAAAMIGGFTVIDFIEIALNTAKGKKLIEKIIAGVNNPVSIIFWKSFNRKFPENSKKSVLTRLFWLVSDERLLLIKGQKQNRINTSKMLDQGMALLIYIPEGILGHDPARMEGEEWISDYVRSAFGKEDTPPEQRCGWVLLVDEGHNYPSSEIATAHVSLRKYKAAIYFDTQSKGQLSEHVRIAAQNSENLIAFESTYDDSTELFKQFGGKIPAEDLRNQITGSVNALIGGHIVCFDTFELGTPFKKENEDEIMAYSLERYYRPIEEVREEVMGSTNSSLIDVIKKATKKLKTQEVIYG